MRKIWSAQGITSRGNATVVLKHTMLTAVCSDTKRFMARLAQLFAEVSEHRFGRGFIACMDLRSTEIAGRIPHLAAQLMYDLSMSAGSLTSAYRSCRLAQLPPVWRHRGRCRFCVRQSGARSHFNRLLTNVTCFIRLAQARDLSHSGLVRASLALAGHGALDAGKRFLGRVIILAPARVVAVRSTAPRPML